jgi:hypothetical protein
MNSALNRRTAVFMLSQGTAVACECADGTITALCAQQATVQSESESGLDDVYYILIVAAVILFLLLAAYLGRYLNGMKHPKVFNGSSGDPLSSGGERVNSGSVVKFAPPQQTHGGSGGGGGGGSQVHVFDNNVAGTGNGSGNGNSYALAPVASQPTTQPNNAGYGATMQGAIAAQHWQPTTTDSNRVTLPPLVNAPQAGGDLINGGLYNTNAAMNANANPSLTLQQGLHTSSHKAPLNAGYQPSWHAQTHQRPAQPMQSMMQQPMPMSMTPSMPMAVAPAWAQAGAVPSIAPPAYDQLAPMRRLFTGNSGSGGGVAVANSNEYGGDGPVVVFGNAAEQMQLSSASGGVAGAVPTSTSYAPVGAAGSYDPRVGGPDDNVAGKLLQGSGSVSSSSQLRQTSMVAVRGTSPANEPW